MFCRQCKSETNEDDSFCPYCGADLRATATPAEQAPAPTPPPAPPTPAAQVAPPTAAPIPPAPAAQAAPPVPGGRPAWAPPPTAGVPAVAYAGGYTKAPLGARLFAVFADSIIAATLVPVGVLLIYAAAFSGETSVVGWGLVGVGASWQFAYTLARDAFGGAGFGKRLTGLVVVSSASGAPASGGATIMRQFVLLAMDLVPVVGSLVEPVLVLTDKDGRRLGDKAAKTQVVRATEAHAHGLSAPGGKTGAIAALLIAVVVMLAGSAVGGIALARSAEGALDGTATPIESVPPAPGDDDTQAPPQETPQSETPADSGDEPTTDAPVAGLNAETATDAVGGLLTSLMNDDVEGMRAFATPYFQETYDYMFYPSSGAFIDFEIVDVFQDVDTWVVVVAEDWNSGPEQVSFIVIEENGQVLVDGALYE